MAWKFKDVKSYLLEKYALVLNRFTGKWQKLPEDSNYGIDLTYQDIFELWKDAKEKFNCLTIGAVQGIFTPYATDHLLKFGMANGFSYHQIYREKDIALYHVAGESFEGKHYRIRYADGEEIVLPFDRLEIIVDDFNHYARTNITIGDLTKYPVNND